MIPIKLDIQGLYSYKEKQTVDFTNLTAAGLFGIFGAVGSGKSSILEGILLALYGSTERLSDRGEKNSMVNLQSDSLQVLFEFKTGPNNAKTYVARYAVKRNSKNFEEIKPAEHTFYEKRGGALVPIEEKAEALLGMKKEHFKQTVIIPQGKFREFIDLTPGPRAEMMKELFGLERFDLASRTARLLKKLREEKIRTETLANAYAELTAESLQELQTELDKATVELKLSKSNFNKSQLLYQQQQSIREYYLRLAELKKEWNDLSEKKPEIEKKQKTHEKYLNAKNFLKPLADGMDALQLDLEKYRVSVTNCLNHKTKYEGDVQAYEVEVENLKNRVSQRPEREAKIRDLQKVLQIQELNKLLFKAQRTINGLVPRIKELEERNKELETYLIAEEARFENCVPVDTTELANWKTAYAEWLRLEKSLETARAEHLDFQKKLDQTLKSSEVLRQELPTELEQLDSWKNAQWEQINKLEQDKELCLQKSGLAVHVHLLETGRPCPLCGSSEHPNPLEELAQNELLNKLNAQILSIKRSVDKALETENRFAQEQFKLEQLSDRASKSSSTLAQIEQELKSIKQNFVASGIAEPQQLHKKIKHSENQLQEAQRIQREIRLKRKEQDELRLEWNSQKEQADTVHKQSLTLGSTIESKKDEISDIAFCTPFFDKDSQTIQNTIDKVNKDIAETALKYDSKGKYLRELREEAARNLAHLSQYQKLLEETQKKLDAQLATYQVEMAKYGFADHDSVISLFRTSLDADAVQAEVRRFEDRCLLVQSQIKDLSTKPGISDFNPSAFERIEQDLQVCKEGVEKCQEQVTLLQQQLLNGTENLKIKTELEKQLQGLELRETNLKELESLFKGSGFVKYVSNIYLKELCNTANIRFRKLTKNALSLEIDENNTFWVIDFLNGGKKRLLKTLSGGQTFQAALCLALALAEKVKHLNQADQSFFFLDEGFGALDRTSLRIVFETLKSLRQENRVVGIISHVEELQQEIEVYAHIKMDPEAGSQVSYSFIR